MTTLHFTVEKLKIRGWVAYQSTVMQVKQDEDTILSNSRLYCQSLRGWAQKEAWIFLFLNTVSQNNIRQGHSEQDGWDKTKITS